MNLVAITGVGVVVPGFQDATQLFMAMLNGKTLIREKRIAEEKSAPIISCASMSAEDFNQLEQRYPQLSNQDVSSAAKMAVAAALEAVKDAGLSLKAGSDKSGLFLGCNKILLQPDDFHLIWKKENQFPVKPDQLARLKQKLNQTRQSQAAEIGAKMLGITGTVKTFGDACSAGSNAIISGYRRIQSGHLDVAVCGGADHATHNLMQLHFNKLGALARNQALEFNEQCRPFDKDRSGFVLGDGAGFLVLENHEHALKRGCQPIAYLVGESRNTEGYRIAHTDEEGTQYELTMRSALQRANLEPEAVSLINAHGTSSLISDSAERKAISRVFNTVTPVNATKASTGHSFGGSAAIESVLNVLALKHQMILPTLNYQEKSSQDSEINIVTTGKQYPLSYILSNAFGLGGENTCLIFIFSLDGA